MKKRNVSRGKFFTPPGPHDPLGNIFAEGGNILVDLGLKKLSREASKLFGEGGIPVRDQMALNHSRLLLEKQESDNTQAKNLGEGQLKLLALKIQEKMIELEERKQRLHTAQEEKAQLNLPFSTEIIRGALELPPVSEGLAGSPDQVDNYTLWLEGLGEPGRVYLILGRRGSGKTALAAKMGEYAFAVYGIPVFWIGLPQEARALLPSWIKMVDSLEQCPAGCLIIADEAGLNFLSLAFNSNNNVLLRKLLMICRHKRCSLVFAGQSSRDIEYSIIRGADCTIFKEPGAFQPESERPDFKTRAKTAALAFKTMTQDEKRQAAYVFSDEFQGIIKSSVPSFWSEELSHIYSRVDLVAMQEQVSKNNELQQVMVEETKQLNSGSLDVEIMKRRRAGDGIEKIAKDLGCTIWRVRKCLQV